MNNNVAPAVIIAVAILFGAMFINQGIRAKGDLINDRLAALYGATLDNRPR